MFDGGFKGESNEPSDLTPEDVTLKAEGNVEGPQEIEDMARLSLDIKELEANINKAERLQEKFKEDPTKKAAYELIQEDYLEDKREELVAKKKRLEELESKNGFQVVEEI